MPVRSADRDRSPATPAPRGGRQDDEPGELGCEHCGASLFYDEGRRCWSCDRLACPACASEDEEPLCPECVPTAMPRHLEPMLATLSDLPVEDGGWAYEFKWDGVRALCYWDGGRLTIESRNQNDVTGRYPELADLGRALGGPTVVDGEIIALDERGRPSFGLLQHRMHLAADKARRVYRSRPVQYYIFDLLWAEGRSLLELPYSERRRLLEGMDLRHASCRVPPGRAGEGRAMLETAREFSLEGIVAKRLDGRYEPGRRSRSWLKVKIAMAQEFVIGGWIPEKGSSERVGSLLLGVHDERGRLVYVGRAGSGFSDADHERLVPELERRARELPPFAGKPPKWSFRPVAPELVAEVQYRRWPRTGQLQQASFKGLRTDKRPTEVVREGGAS